MEDNMLGEIRVFAGNYAPRNWALCDGSLLSISQHAALYTLIGVTYGGDGRNTFALPDLRGRLLVQNGQGPGLSNYPFAAKGGQEKVTLTVGQMPVHRHEFTVGTIAATTNEPGNNFLAAPVDKGNPSDSAVLAYLPFDNNDHSQVVVPLGSSTLGFSGGSQPHENRQPYLPINYIISLQGTYPTWDE